MNVRLQHDVYILSCKKNKKGKLLFKLLITTEMKHVYKSGELCHATI